MTYRHHFAELISTDATAHSYRFTPDSILMKEWGVVKMSDSGFEIVQMAPDDGEWGWTEEKQHTCCTALFAKFLRVKKSEGKAPARIEFVA